jgi:transcription elongation factor S-II
METIETARTTIQNYLNKTNDDESLVIAAIEELSYVEMDVDLIRNTGIGRVIAKLSKDKRSERVSAEAKTLETRLKSMVEAPTTKTEKRSRTNSTKESQTKKRNVSTPEKSAPPEKKIEKETKSSSIPTPSGDFKGETNNAARNMVQSKLHQALSQPTSVVGGVERDPTRVTVLIESTLFKKYGDAKHKEYQAKFRSLFSNLKDPLNEGLRSALFTGDLSIDTLIGMTHEELANPSLQQERQKLKAYQQEARRGDRHMRDATCTMFTCNKCGQNKTTYFQLQTRSADEPMTTFVTCCACGNHWKF